MTKSIYLKGKQFYYEFERKNVKNINLRIRRDGSIYVSASKRTSQMIIDDFLISKSDFIFKAVERCQAKEEKIKTAYFSESEIVDVIINLCNEVYPYFQKRGVKYPEIKFRKMVSCWGSCRPVKGVLTFNINLMYAPIECVRYVVLHEFTHFLQANHSSEFYKELSITCPDWKIYKNKLKEIPCSK